MVHPSVVRALLLALFLSYLGLSTCLLLKGSVACGDCGPGHDLSGIKVMVKCSEERLVSATTSMEGFFEVEVPKSSSVLKTSNNPGCLATVLGGPEQLYATKRSIVSEFNEPRESSGFYTLAAPLTFLTCPPDAEQPKLEEIEIDAPKDFRSSKILGFPPFPFAGFALPPSDYFLRFFPIIGIP